MAIDPKNNLIQQLQKGNHQAFEQLFKQLYPSMWIVANKYVKNSDVAEDIAQEAFIKFWENCKKYDSLQMVKSYLYVSVKNLSLNYLRKEKNKESYVEKAQTNPHFFSNAVLQEESYRLLYQAVEALPKRSASVIKLSLQGVKNKEIAERLNISVNTVKTLKYNALKTLKEQLKNHVFTFLILVNM